MKRTVGFLAAVTVVLWTMAPMPSTAEICGEASDCRLLAGATGTDVGSVTVSNDGDTLYVTYETDGTWCLTDVQLYVGTGAAPGQRLAPGQAPYKAEDLAVCTQSHTIEVPLADNNFVCDETAVWLQAHAAIQRLNDDGVVVQEETAYGSCDGVTRPRRGAWYANMSYAIQCCGNPPPPCFDCTSDTSWAAGSRYVDQGNWATYTAYEGVPKAVDLYAGQTKLAGTVHFSAPVGGQVTVTIALNPGWEFVDDPENVHIQDYESAPSGNPAPGQFDSKFGATGSSFEGSVPENDFYGVHAVVQECVEVPCE